MNFQEIDPWCDLYEHRLRRGDVVSISEFLRQNGLPKDASLVAELQKVESEYRQQRQVPRAGDGLRDTACHPTEAPSPDSVSATNAGDRPNETRIDGSGSWPLASRLTGFANQIFAQLKRIGFRWTRRKSSRDDRS